MITTKQSPAGICLLLLTFLAACLPTQAPKEVLSLPNSYYGAVLRFPDGAILIDAGHLQYYALADGRFIEIPFQEDTRCRRTSYTLPTALPDGKIGFNMICDGRWPERPIGQDGARYLVAYDWGSQQFEQIVAEPLPIESGVFSWHPEMIRGVQEVGSLFRTLTWLTPTQADPITLTITDGQRSWSLAENLNEVTDTTRVGTVRYPAWSPDGRFIAFWAASNVVQYPSGTLNPAGIYNLYLLDPDALQLQTILRGVAEVGPVVWSPNSQWLAFTGVINAFRDNLWLVSVNGRVAERVARGSSLEFWSSFNGWNWLDEQAIIATRCLDEDCAQTEVAQHDVSWIVEMLGGETAVGSN